MAGSQASGLCPKKLRHQEPEMKKFACGREDFEYFATLAEHAECRGK
jgi:hypothetical protein